MYQISQMAKSQSTPLMRNEWLLVDSTFWDFSSFQRKTSRVTMEHCKSWKLCWWISRAHLSRTDCYLQTPMSWTKATSSCSIMYQVTKISSAKPYQRIRLKRLQQTQSTGSSLKEPIGRNSKRTTKLTRSFPCRTPTTISTLKRMWWQRLIWSLRTLTAALSSSTDSLWKKGWL